MHSDIRVGLLGEFKQERPAHLAIPAAMEAASEGHVECVWISTDSVGKGESLAEFDGIWCVPGMPYRSASGALEGIRYARVTRTPFLGTSAGFQYALIEFARNALGLAQADHQVTVMDSGMRPFDRTDFMKALMLLTLERLGRFTAPEAPAALSDF